MYEFLDLYEAAELDELDKVKKILASNPALIHGRDEYEFTVLHGAVNTENVEMIRYLIEQGADVNAQNDEGYTPLHIALYPDVADCLLAHGALINLPSYDGSTPLHTQVSDGEERWDVIMLLLARGADRHLKDEEGYTPLDVALQREEKEIAAILRG
ncbi:Ankyrin repeats (3 copies) [compost metagenome]